MRSNPQSVNNGSGNTLCCTCVLGTRYAIHAADTEDFMFPLFIVKQRLEQMPFCLGVA